MANWKKLIVSGSDANLSSLSVDTSVSAQSFSGSFSGSFEGDGSNLTGVGAFPYTGSAGILGSLNLAGNANINGGANFDVFATPKTASGNSIIPDNYYATIYSPVLVAGTITVGTGSILKVEPF
jgi:hypothetical protein